MEPKDKAEHDNIAVVKRSKEASESQSIWTEGDHKLLENSFSTMGECILTLCKAGSTFIYKYTFPLTNGNQMEIGFTIGALSAKDFILIGKYIGLLEETIKDGKSIR